MVPELFEADCLDYAFEILTDYYSSAKSIGLDLEDFHSILKLSKELTLRELPVREVRFALAAESGRVAPLLEVVCKLEESGVSLAELDDWLARQRKPSRPTRRRGPRSGGRRGSHTGCRELGWPRARIRRPRHPNGASPLPISLLLPGGHAAGARRAPSNGGPEPP